MSLTYHPAPDLLKNRVILITGAGDGIGRAAALSCAQHGATVILLGKTPQKLEVTYDAIMANGGPEPAILSLDLKGARIKEYEQVREMITQHFGRLDGLLHNAAYLGGLTPLAHYPAQQWMDVMQVNLHAPFLLTQTLLPLLKASTDASVLFTGDSVGLHGKAYWGAYGVSKAAIKNLMEILADELETNTPIRVNAIQPPPVLTRIRQLAYPGEDGVKLVKPQDIMTDYLYWLGPDSRGKTGQWIEIRHKEKNV